MTKTISVTQLGNGGAARAIEDAQDEPILVSREDGLAAWLVGSDALARLSAARGADPDAYGRALELVAVDLYERHVLTLGDAAALAGLNLGDFIDLCGRLRVPILWPPPDGIDADVEALEAVLEEAAART